MKNPIFWTWSLGLALAALPLAGGCDQESAESAPVSVNSNDPSIDPAAITDAPAPEMTETQLENAPGKIVSLAQPSAAAAHLSSSSSEIVKLAQAGVDESVMLSYATNSPRTFNLSSDDIIYLNDIGVPPSVVTAMIGRDQTLQGTAPGTTVATTPPVDTNQLVPAPGTPTPYPGTMMDETAGSEMADYSEPSDQSNVSSTYFYDSLAPYGNWIDVAGYGRCWQPTVVVVNPGWQPYCDRGHWVYSDCGWYWSSGYSWGWAPFHYGRWFNHSHWGWCWAPDTVWGPSWVTWRYTPGYCGWAPLPPSACFTPGVGFSHHGQRVSVSFGFGLTASRFTFVSANRFLDPHPEHHRLPPESSRHAFNNSVVFNQITQGRNNTVINEGIPVSHVAAATHTEIRRVHIRDASDPVSTRSEHIERDGSRSVAAFRPNLPQPTHSTALVGEGVRPAPRNETSARAVRTTGSQANGPRQVFTEANSNARDRRPDATPAIRNNSLLPTGNDAPTANSPRDPRTAPATGRTSPIIMRGPDRSNSPDNERATAPRGSVIMSGPPRDANRVPTLNQQPPPTAPTTAATPGTSPIQNNSPRVIVNSNQRQYTPPGQQTPSPAPGQNQRDQRVLRSSEPGYPQYPQQNQRVYSQPAPPVQVPQSPVYQQPRVPEPPQQYRQANPAPQSPPPTVNSQPAPRNEPRVESRQAPPPQQQQQQQQQSAPQVRSQDTSSARQAPSPGSGAGGGGGGGGNGRRNR